MRVMVIVKATEDSEAGVMPEQELLEAMGRYNEELVKAGVMLAGERCDQTVVVKVDMIDSGSGFVFAQAAASSSVCNAPASAFGVTPSIFTFAIRPSMECGAQT